MNYGDLDVIKLYLYFCFEPRNNTLPGNILREFKDNSKHDLEIRISLEATLKQLICPKEFHLDCIQVNP